MSQMSEFNLLSLFSLVCNKKKLDKLGSMDKFKMLREEPAVKTLRRHHALVFRGQVALNFWFILLQKKPRSMFDVVYDGSQPPGKTTSYWIVTLSRRGKAKRQRVCRSEEKLSLKKLS